MANGQVEIHDPISTNHNGATCEPKTKTTSSECDVTMDDSVEFRILMAYAKRRRPTKPKDTDDVISSSPPHGNGAATEVTPQQPTEIKVEQKSKKSKKRLKGLKHFRSILSCIRPQKVKEEEEVPEATRGRADNRIGELVFVGQSGLVEEEEEEEEEEDVLEEVADRLTEISDEIPFSPPDLETDSPDSPEDVEKVIGLLLREKGDQLNDEALKKAIMGLGISWSYGFYENLIKSLLRRMGLWTDPESPGPQASPKTQIAVTCEVTSRLSAADTLPMSRMLSHGARYLQNHYAHWAQEQGGYEAAFHSDEEDDD